MSFHYYWMPDVCPPQFDTVDSILYSAINVLYKEHRVLESEKPQFLIRKSKVGPGAYFAVQNKLIVNLQSYTTKGETPITLLCHEFGHYEQYRSGKFDLQMAKRGKIVYDCIEYPPDTIARVRDQEEYERLPWERDAIHFQKVWEPIIKKKLRLQY